MSQPSICSYCNNEIRPFDNHGMKIEADTQIIEVTGKINPTIFVTCVLKRIYEIKELGQIK